MMEQRCIIDELVEGYRDLVYVQVPSWYAKPKGSAPLPKRLGCLYAPAAADLDRALIEISKAGGHVWFSDMFRSSTAQAKAHQDYLTGRKSAYSPPAGASMHEAGRAFDLDPGDTGIGLKKIKEILAAHGWTGIADRGSECWHHDWRGPDGQSAYEAGSAGMSRYRAMARHCIQVIRNPSTDDEHLSRVKEIQTMLNQVWPHLLTIDGIYGPKTKDAVTIFQMSKGLKPDGIVGPLTWEKFKGAAG